VNLLVIIPTYNEKDSLPELVPRVLAYAGTRVLVVDDDSPDGTGRVADDLADRHPGQVEVLHRSGPRGLGHAYVEGIRHALRSDAEIFCQMDADLSHDAQYLPSMVAATATHDLVIGSRYLNGISVVNWPLRRLALSTAANGYIRWVTGLPVRDCTSGFRCWRRQALERVHLERLHSEGYAFLVEMLHTAWLGGCRLAEVPIIFVERRQGASKLSSGILLESALMPWRLRLRQVVQRRHGVIA
jgi:dolichol-phosphate mannosyltransferase